ncbi:hypothetical protein Tco_0621058 [Tanacetum coccineum]
MDDPNITMEEYTRLEEEKARGRAIAFNDGVSSEKTLSCEPTVSSLNDEIDFRISFDDSDDEDYTSNKEVFSGEIVSLRSILWEIVSLDEEEQFTSFQDDAKYEHVGQDPRSQDGKDNKDKQGKDLKISKQKTKSKDNDKGSRSTITKHEGMSLQHYKDQ